MITAIIGHRGCRGLRPENTLAAFSRAIEIGVDYIELDVGVTKDKVVVVHHDYHLNPETTRNATGNWITNNNSAICDLALADLKQYDVGKINPESDYCKQFPKQVSVDGSVIPTLKQTFQLLDEKSSSVKLLIEAKSTPVQPQATLESIEFANTLVNEITSLEFENRVVVQSFNWQLLHEVKKLSQKIEVWHLTSQMKNYNTIAGESAQLWTAGLKVSDYENSVPKLVRAANGTCWGCNVDALSKELIGEAHSEGLKVCAWTANSPKEFEFLIEAGIDGIVTDYPDRLVEFLG